MNWLPMEKRSQQIRPEHEDTKDQILTRLMENADYYANLAQDLERAHRKPQRQRPKAKEGS